MSKSLMVSAETEARRRDILYRYLERQSIEKIAKVYSVTPQYVKRVLKDPQIVAEKERIVGMMMQHMATRLEMLVPEAVDTVRDVMRGDNESELQLKAASKILDTSSLGKKAGADGDVVKDLGAAIIRELGKQMVVTVAPKIEQQDAQVIEINAEEISASDDPIRSDD